MYRIGVVRPDIYSRLRLSPVDMAQGLVADTRVCCIYKSFVTFTDACNGRLGPTVLTGFTTAFQTHIFSILPGSFSKGFKDLVSATLDAEYSANPPTWMATLFEPADPTLMRWDQPLWLAFEQLGMIERYESLISSVCYEHIESHILATCAQVWDKPSLAAMRAWMTQQIVPWLIMPYARGARNGTRLVSYNRRIDVHVKSS